MIRNQYQDDYIMRQVQALAAAVARILGLQASADQGEALTEAQRTLRNLTGADPGLLAAVAPATLVEWIRRDASDDAARPLMVAAILLLREYARLLAAAGCAEDAAAFEAHAAWIVKYTDANR